jgi:hypothetical protein
MYQSKRNGRNLVSYFGNESDTRQRLVAAQLLMLSALQDALQRNEFFVEYQPIRDLQDDQVVGLEALIRWRKADGTIVPPDQFIPVAEQSRLIVYIGRWVIEQVCRDCRACRRRAAECAGARQHGGAGIPRRRFAARADGHRRRGRRRSVADLPGADRRRHHARIEKTLPIMRAGAAGL